ncbi:hypothetical protein PR048_016810 [Dryococelus australis]|uniref:Uncharacterized protein n=1 Tax=Dryococelus australis TaxID=614101 RepID=A0ABQ9H8A7_9NEOP|nr:hypothetical protein PR048_016810 [Dryococelus australis]
MKAITIYTRSHAVLRAARSTRPCLQWTRMSSNPHGRCPRRFSRRNLRERAEIRSCSRESLGGDREFSNSKELSFIAPTAACEDLPSASASVDERSMVASILLQFPRCAPTVVELVPVYTRLSGNSSKFIGSWRATVAERLARSPPTKAIRAQSPAGSLDFHKKESCWTMPLVGGSSRGSPVSPVPSFRRRSIFTPITLIDSEGLAAKSRSNLHSLIGRLFSESTNETRRKVCSELTRVQDCRTDSISKLTWENLADMQTTAAGLLWFEDTLHGSPVCRNEDTYLKKFQSVLLRRTASFGELRQSIVIKFSRLVAEDVLFKLGN